MVKLLIILIPFLLMAVKPKLLLLNTYKDQNITSWVMSEKLDGIRAYWDGKNLISRGGKIIHAPKWFIEDYPSFEIDGELWTKRNDFENISSIVRDKNPSKHWKNIKHYIFEVPNAKGGLFQRLEKVKPYMNNSIRIIPQIEIRDKDHLNEFLQSIENEKGEGVVVRDPKEPYINKRSSKALKIKTYHDMECTVIGYTKGKGKFTDLIGAIKCKLDNGMTFKIGSGLSDNERKYPAKIGDIITFKYNGFTKYGKPRFPVYLRIRYKKSER
jgi:DNA ligase-1